MPARCSHSGDRHDHRPLSRVGALARAVAFVRLHSALRQCRGGAGVVVTRRARSSVLPRERCTTNASFAQWASTGHVIRAPQTDRRRVRWRTARPVRNRRHRARSTHASRLRSRCCNSCIRMRRPAVPAGAVSRTQPRGIQSARQAAPRRTFRRVCPLSLRPRPDRRSAAVARYATRHAGRICYAHHRHEPATPSDLAAAGGTLSDPPVAAQSTGCAGGSDSTLRSGHSGPCSMTGRTPAARRPGSTDV